MLDFLMFSEGSNGRKWLSRSRMKALENTNLKKTLSEAIYFSHLYTHKIMFLTCQKSLPKNIKLDIRNFQFVDVVLRKQLELRLSYLSDKIFQNKDTKLQLEIIF